MSWERLLARVHMEKLFFHDTNKLDRLLRSNRFQKIRLVRLEKQDLYSEKKIFYLNFNTRLLLNYWQWHRTKNFYTLYLKTVKMEISQN